MLNKMAKVKQIIKKPIGFWERVKRDLAHTYWFYFLVLISVILLIVSFLLPPQGVIDSSVIQATGELFAFGALGTLIHAINRGVDAKIQKGNTSIEIGELNGNPHHIEEISYIEEEEDTQAK